MHPSTYQRCEEFARSYLDDARALRIADVGSYDVNGTYRDIFTRPSWNYTGFDLEAGPNVDVVLSTAEDWKLEPADIGAFDVVVSGQVLEHVRRPWLWIQQLVKLSKVGGLIWICAPNSWGYHEFPIDCWRIWPDGMRALFEDVGIQELGCHAIGPDTVGIGRYIGIGNRTSEIAEAYLPLIDILYWKATRTPSDIFQHLPILRSLAEQCENVTEFGTRGGVSTTALLSARPRRLTCYDLSRSGEIELLEKAAREVNVAFQLIQRSTVEPGFEIEETDFLFIDTLHTYRQLLNELRLHGHKARRYLAFHDFTTFGLRDEVDQGSEYPGLLPAFFQFLAESKSTWRIAHYNPANNGLVVLENSDSTR